MEQSWSKREFRGQYFGSPFFPLYGETVESSDFVMVETLTI